MVGVDVAKVRRITRALPFLALSLCLPVFFPQSASAATITVTSASGGTGGPDCTLRDAITAADSDTATGGCSAGSGADVIELPTTTITLTDVDNSDVRGANGLPLISTDITINGNGATIERDTSLTCNLDGAMDAGEFRIIHVATGGGLTLNDLSLSNGCADGADFRGWGGALQVWVGASLATDNVTITGSRADEGGGGLYLADLSTATLTDTAVTDNLAAGINGGGGIWFVGTTLTLEDGVMSGNQATSGSGGGLMIAGSASTATLLRTTVDGNSTSSSGGGVFNFGELHVVQSTVSNNTAASFGGGLAITNIADLLFLMNSTISGNSAATGGGVWNAAAMQIGYSTITDNTASSGGGLVINTNADGQTLEVLNSIVADNTSGGDCSFETPLTSVLGENLDSDGSCTGFSVQSTDPMLAPLADYGGPTFTHALYDGSPAIDVVPAGTCDDFTPAPLLVDQRDVARPVDGDADSQATCDIGAFEWDTSLPPPLPQQDPVAAPLLGAWAIALLGLLLAGMSAGRLRRNS